MLAVEVYTRKHSDSPKKTFMVPKVANTGYSKKCNGDWPRQSQCQKLRASQSAGMRVPASVPLC